jgi:hypothetical protein
MLIWQGVSVRILFGEGVKLKTESGSLKMDFNSVGVENNFYVSNLCFL